ncbi:MAG: HaeIII family restriction endonuclease [Bacteroidales bacterium]|nr:HaeIII family restriction endonuclease [Bacteroidales bacterium]
MTTINSTIKGKAYEYACVVALDKIVSKYRKITIENNESLKIAKDRFGQITSKEQKEMLLSAHAGISSILQMEPRIIEDGKDSLSVSLQPDNVAKQFGDIRDILIIRRSIKWKIGVSVKHNHSALKHSRLSIKLDFGKEWTNTPCSKKYFNEIKPIFEQLTELKSKGKKWSQIAKKEDKVYVPILQAFSKELVRLNKENNITNSLMKYLIGSNGRDYYKLIHSNKHTTKVIPFNVYGTLNLSSTNQKPKIKIPKIILPTKIINLEFKEKSKNTIILTMNNGWAISFRIHNASTIVEPSLKFDVQLFGSPDALFYIDAKW